MLHTCTPDCRHDPSIQRQRSANNPYTIDFHCHILSPKVEQLVAGHPEKAREGDVQKLLMGESSVRHNREVMTPPAVRRMTSIEERIADMDAMGVDLQVMSPSPLQYYYWADEALAEQLCREQNENIVAHCSRYPDRLRGLGAVALQHPKLAAKHVRECVKKYGLAGVEISSVAGSRELSDPLLNDFWSAADEVGALVFLHPMGTSLGERVATHYLSNIIGQPLETTIALSRLILDGVFDRHPGLRVVAAHGGGYLPSYSGRLDHGARVRPEAGKDIAERPSTYFKRIWFDTVVYEPQVLRHLVNTVGASQLIVGTDYPYDMGDYDIHALISSIPGITDAERRQILGGNAAGLLGLALPTTKTADS